MIFLMYFMHLLPWKLSDFEHILEGLMGKSTPLSRHKDIESFVFFLTISATILRIKSVVICLRFVLGKYLHNNHGFFKTLSIRSPSKDS